MILKQGLFRLGYSEYLNILVAILYTAAALVFFFYVILRFCSKLETCFFLDNNMTMDSWKSVRVS